jgi:hypothetical protein
MDACNGDETCDLTLGCQPGTDLSCDNANVCDGTETCNAATGCENGTALTPPNDSDPNDCLIVSDTCDPTEGYELVVAPVDTVCSDGDACTTDVCNGSDAACQSTLACDNGDFCDGVETCGSEGCVSGDAPIHPDDGPNDCVMTTCDEDSDTLALAELPEESICLDETLEYEGFCLSGECIFP